MWKLEKKKMEGDELWSEKRNVRKSRPWRGAMSRGYGE